MDNKKIKLEVLFQNKEKELSSEKIINILLKNRGIKTLKDQKVFLNPVHPEKISLEDLKIERKEVNKSIKRLKEALKNKEKIFIYGDYDADGICGTAVLWETLHKLGFDVLPYIPERFSEGYGVNFESLKILKEKYPKLKVLITVDNGIVAVDEIEKINKLGIDVIVTDHHQKGRRKLKSYSTIHTTKVSGAAVSWLFSREILKKMSNKKLGDEGLDLVAIGTIADQVSLLDANRSFAKWGLIKLNETKRVGLISLFREARLNVGEIDTYEVGFVIAPRINATGRIEHGIDSLRLLCTKSPKRAIELANSVGKLNQKRQRIVNEVVERANKLAEKSFSEKALIISDENFHEGVIGLAASKLVEIFYKPAIVISKGRDISKASARSIVGFNIIENIRKLENLLEDGGGHPMAAGFSILTKNIEKFKTEFQKIAKKNISDDLLSKKIKIDTGIDFNSFNLELIDKIYQFEPFGIGNPRPIFITDDVSLLDIRLVGKDKKHLKLLFEKNGRVFDGIAFFMADLYTKLSKNKKNNIIFSLEKNIWDGREKIQLKIKEIFY